MKRIINQPKKKLQEPTNYEWISFGNTNVIPPQKAGHAGGKYREECDYALETGLPIVVSNIGDFMSVLSSAKNTYCKHHPNVNVITRIIPQREEYMVFLRKDDSEDGFESGREG